MGGYIMATLNDATAYINALLGEIDLATQADNNFHLAIIDLVVSNCNFAMQKWSELQPDDPTVAILLLGIEHQCLRIVDKLKLAQKPASTQEGN